ncbi:Pentatricopeptide repeat-containing protein [Capsicum baccatum]|uniref:Pentatricopeptide repeat-containing protein n=1 Tax=Capsicum baccatum TaxID=33114 RepID=A0A2G2VQZ6_CAPBA|nr:Pentatricopeptide repeat-containing protein [Capsicum baccatum]
MAAAKSTAATAFVKVKTLKTGSTAAIKSTVKVVESKPVFVKVETLKPGSTAATKSTVKVVESNPVKATGGGGGRGGRLSVNSRSLIDDETTLSSSLLVTNKLGDLKFGSWIESFIRGTGIQMDDYLATSLIDLYAKCGSIDKAYNLFHGLIKKDLVAYTAMILGCGINGRANDAIELFDEMMNAEINPNIVTITGILTAYSHIGMVEEAYLCFISLQKYGLSPSVDHYAIVVDVLSRAGRLEEAHGLIKGMSNQPHAGVWGALLLGCSLHNNLELGEIAAAHCIELEPDSSGYRSLLANIYASSGRWDDAERLRKGVEETGYNKLPGCSWIEEAKA